MLLSFLFFFIASTTTSNHYHSYYHYHSSGPVALEPWTSATFLRSGTTRSMTQVWLQVGGCRCNTNQWPLNLGKPQFSPSPESCGLLHLFGCNWALFAEIWTSGVRTLAIPTLPPLLNPAAHICFSNHHPTLKLWNQGTTESADVHVANTVVVIFAHCS